jgi:hypothetical protein
MPRGKYYPEEMREEARRLRREGWSLNEIAAKLGPPKNTLTLWVRGIELTSEQRARLFRREHQELGRNRALAAMANRQARLARINAARQRAEMLLDSLRDHDRTNHIVAAMLYLAEGAKAETAFTFANSNPQIIRYWLYLLRTSFDIDESKFRLHIMTRADQDGEELLRFWMEVTGIKQYIKTYVDTRTEGKPTKRAAYKGVCAVVYHDVSIRRYLDALAQGLMSRALEDEVPD